MAVYKRDLVDINLETGNIHRSFLKHSIGYKDQQADHFGVRVYRDGEPVNLTGVSVQGVFMPPQGSPIAITTGNIVSDNVAEVVLPQACYNYDGQFTLAIKLVDSTNEVTGTVRIVDGMVDNTHASGTVAPTSAVPTYQEVLSAYEQAIAVIGASVRFDQTQSLTDAQKATARSNIGAPSTAEMNTALALKVNVSDIENDLTGTTAGKVLDARQGKVLDDKVSDLKTALDTIPPKVGGESEKLNDPNTDTLGAYLDENGAEHIETGSKTYWRHTALIDIEEFTQIKWVNGNAASLNHLNWFYTSDNTPISSFAMAVSGTVNVPQTAKYVAFTTSKANASLLITGVYYGTMNARLDNVDNLQFIEDNGYKNMLDHPWVRGGYYAWNDFRTNLYKYRASIYPMPHFDVDTYVVCKRGFQVVGTAKINGEIVSQTGNFSCIFVIPAGADATFTIRRIIEDTTEELTDEQVIEFANSAMIVNVRGSNYELTRDTFTGFEMYNTMAIIGDSYSAGNNGNNWGKCLGRMIGTQVTVWAQSGYRTAEWITTYMPQMLAADPLDLYWLNLGINDGATVTSDPSYLGTVADVNETTYPDVDDFPNTFWGNYGRIIRNIQIHAPNAKIVMEQTLFGNMRNAQVDTETTSTLTINNAIKAIAEHYSLPCIDQLDDPFYTSREYADSMNGNHPRLYAWVGMANANRRLFAKAVLKNPSYFY